MEKNIIRDDDAADAGARDADSGSEASGNGDSRDNTEDSSPISDDEERRLMRTPRFLPVLAVTLAIMFPLLAGGPAEAHHDRLEGLWNLVDEILDACPTGNTIRTVIDMKMFIHDGSMIETPGSPGVGAPPLKRVIPGLGSWQHVGWRQYTASFRFFRYDSTDDTFAGTQTALVHIELAEDGKTLTTATTTDVFDANGALITTRCTTGSGTRVE